MGKAETPFASTVTAARWSDVEQRRGRCDPPARPAQQFTASSDKCCEGADTVVHVGEGEEAGDEARRRHGE
eukprot:3436417-Pleurochrysis_carterae.AAC.2